MFGTRGLRATAVRRLFQSQSGLVFRSSCHRGIAQRFYRYNGACDEITPLIFYFCSFSSCLHHDMPWPRRYPSLLVGFFGATTLAFLRTSSSVELCLQYPELRFLVFCRIRFCMDGSYGFRARKNFSVALFLVVSGRLVSGPAFVPISGISSSAFLFGIFFMGSVMQNLLPKNFAVTRCLVFWSVGRLCGGCFAIFGGWIFVFCPELLLMGRVKEDLLPNNFAVTRCLVFLSVCRLCGGCFAILGG